MASRYSADALIHFASALLARAGLDPEKSSAVATTLVEGDLLGHTTHGLQLLAAYLADLEKGAMAKIGAPRVIADFPAAVTWDGQRLPGPWLTRRGIDLAIERARKNGTATVVIRRSHHIACLQAYLQRVTAQKLVIVLTCSDPTVGGVAPHGGTRGVYTPNPIAAAWPTSGAPVMMDVSQSITTHGMTRRLHQSGEKLPGAWVIDAGGYPTNDPSVMFANPPGALLPVGGIDHGHKGYALGLLVEALTGGLSGHGRAEPPEGWTATTFIQVFDPALYGGIEAFEKQMDWLSAACHASPPRPGFDQVRLPGEAALRRRESQLKTGVALFPSILPALAPWAAKWAVPAPEPLDGDGAR